MSDRAVEAIAERLARIGQEEFNGPGDPDEFREDAVKVLSAVLPVLEEEWQARLAAADRLAEVVESGLNEVGEDQSDPELAAALAAYREVGR